MIFQGIELAVVAAAMAELHWLLTVYLVLHYLEERQCLKFSHRRLIDNAILDSLMAVDSLNKLAGFYLQHTAVGSKFLVIYSIYFHGVPSLHDYPTGQGIAASSPLPFCKSATDFSKLLARHEVLLDLFQGYILGFRHKADG